MEVVAKDVVFSIQESIKIVVAFHINYNIITEIKLLDRYRFQITLKKIYPFLLHVLATLRTGIVPLNYGGKSKKEFQEDPIGTGRFKFKAWEKGDLLLERFTDYHQKPPNIKLVRIRFTKNIDEIKSVLAHQEIQELNLVFPKYREELLPILLDKNYKKFSYPSFMTVVIGMNQSLPLFQNISMRRFLQSLFHTSDLKKILSDDSGKLASGFIPAGMMGSLPLDKDAGKTDFELLKILYNHLNLKRQVTMHLLTYFTLEKNARIEGYCQNILKDFPNIRIKVVRKDFEELKNDCYKQDYELVSLRWLADIAHPHFYLGWFASNSTQNYWGIKDHFIDQQLENFTDMPKEKAAQYFRKIDAYLVDQALIIPIYYTEPEYYFPHYLKNFKPSILGIASFDFNEIEYEKKQSWNE